MTEETKINRNYTRSGLAFVTSVLFLCAWILFGIGIWLVIDPMYYEPAEGTVLRNENDKLLSIFVVGMLIVLLLCIASIVLAVSYGFSDKLEDYLARQISLNIQRLYDSEHSNAIINFIQIKFRCCGATYVTDYERYRMTYPMSCVSDVYGNPNFLYFEGCAYKMTRFYETRAAIILGMFSFISLFILLAISFSIMFYCSLVNKSVES